jgi:hypothetical protein
MASPISPATFVADDLSLSDVLYTDVMGLPAYYVGLMFLVTRLVDGVADVLMGLVIDNTATRWGAVVRIC